MPRSYTENPLSTEELNTVAQKYNVTTQTIRNWILKGIDPLDEKAVTEYRAHHSGAGDPDLRERRQLAETLRLEEQAILARLEREKLERKLIDLIMATETIQTLGAVTSAKFAGLENELPPLLEGKTAKEMGGIIKIQVKKILEELAEYGFEEGKAI
jgi:hypothetical protein